MKAIALSAARLPRWSGWVLGSLALTLAGAAAGYHLSGLVGVPQTHEAAGTTTEPPGGEPPAEGIVRLDESRWSAVGVTVGPAASGEFTERVWRSGRLGPDEARVAHISPPVEGIVREVRVRLGQDVKAGDVLAVLDSREVGQAKLDLVKARLAAEYAQAHHDWTGQVGRNAAELVAAMLAETPIAELEQRFRDRAIGELRQQLVTAYSRRAEARAQYASVTQPALRGAVAETNVVKLRAENESAEAAFRALCEEVKFQSAQQARDSAQKLREAQTAEALAKARLMMLGYTREEVDALDPIAEGPKVSLHPVRAPFAGTVVEQHAVTSEQVGPDLQMFQLVDLGTLWLRADAFEKDLPVTRQMAGRTLRFRTGDGTGELHEAEVFYAGDVVDPDTRAVTLLALVKNPGRLLKPGQFVEAELARPGGQAVQVPVGAIQRQGTQTFVFTHAGGGEFRRQDVTLGRESGGVVEVTAGLRPGQPVVTGGGFVLKSELFRDQMAGD